MKMRRRLFAALVSAGLAACSFSGASSSSPPASGPASTAARSAPALVVLLVVDGLPMRQLSENRSHFAPDGFRRFMDQGRWYADAHYAQALTVTAAGHAVMLSGAYPQRSGIIANEWRDPQTGATVYCTGDEAERYLGGHATPPLSGTSPRNLKAETVGDVLRGLRPESKVIGISGKDRGAILPAGRLGTAYMYMSETGRFASSSYYMARHPDWVDRFNAAKPADAYFQKTWSPLLPEAAYAGSTPDGQPWQIASAIGNRLPAVIGEKAQAPGPRFYGDLLVSPFADELTFNFALAAVAGEGLGQRGGTDILSVSLSSHDYVNHSFGPDSRLSKDHLLHLDRHLQTFFARLDQVVGKDRYVAILTADHGFADTPETAQAKGQPAGRYNPAQTLALLNAAVAQRLGLEAGVRVVLHTSAGGLLLDEGLMASRGLQTHAVHTAIQNELVRLPGMGAAYTLAQIQSPTPGDEWLQAVRKSWYAGRSAPVQFVLKPGWMSGARPGGSTHGTPHRYDTHVPLMFWGARYVSPGEVKTRAEVADLAPTLSALLRQRAPAQSQGRDLRVGIGP